MNGARDRLNKFLIVKAKDSAALQRVKARLKERAFDLLPYHPDRIRVREFSESNVLFANFEITDTGGFAKHHVATTERTTFAFDGLPYSEQLDVNGNWAEQFMRTWTDDQTTIESVYGTWAFARFDAVQGGRVLSDFTGMTPVFYWHDNEFLAISPRQMLLAGVIGDLEYDLQTMAWLTGQANLIGDKAVWKGVKHLPPQWSMTFSPKPGDLDIAFERREIYADTIDPNPDEGLLEGVKNSMLAQCEALARLPFSSIKMDITGGLDSRLVLALASQTSLKSKIENLSTYGTEENHEIQIGRAIAQSVGIPHVARVLTPNAVDPLRIIGHVRSRMFRYEASICPCDGHADGARHSRVVVTGSAGEIYRRNCKPHLHIDLKSESELYELFGDYHQKTDPLGVEMPWVADWQRAAMRGYAMDYWRAGAHLNDVTDIFYMRYRLPLWNGMMMNNIHGAARVYPLVNYFAAKYAFSRGSKARVGDRIHFEIMLKVSPALCAMPFLNFVWPKEYRDYAAEKGVHVSERPYAARGPNTLAQQVGQIDALVGPGWNMAMDYILGEQNSPLWDVIDKAAVERVAKEGSSGFRGVVPAKQIFSLVGMQAALSGDVIRDLDGKADAPPVLDGRTAQEIFSPR